ncbi:ribokinase [Salmonella enterica subsp. enterica]|uniref:Ribokinase n=1 Tax=Salmonella enterica I TaxID=59201 RepID=A0A379VTE4_SALET|nr:ribokinase [Salmonella enterica subsp. enterica]
MFKEERRHAIINLLIKDNSVSVSKLSDLYKVSQETIRSDLRYFQKSGMLQRCYGGGILNRDALSKLITENKIDISSTIATPIHQDAKLRRETQKSRQGVCFRLLQY